MIAVFCQWEPERVTGGQPAAPRKNMKGRARSPALFLHVSWGNPRGGPTGICLS